MSGDSVQILIAMLAYLALVVGIGFYFSKRANESSEKLLYWRTLPGAMGNGYECRSLRYERLASDGVTRCGLLVGFERCHLDGYRAGGWHLSQLAAGSQAVTPLFGCSR